jgi:type II secretory pathway component GspD/PulD (secretin)
MNKAIPHRATAAIALCAALAAGCTTLERGPMSKEFGALSAANPRLPPAEAVVGMSAEDEVQIAEANMFIALPMSASEPLPDLEVRGLTFSGSTPDEVVRMITAGTDISVVTRGDSPNAAILRHSVAATNVSGKLADVLARLSDSVGFYFNYNNRVLEISPDLQFIVELPPVNTLFESLPQMVKVLGATDIFLDKSARTMTYRATKPNHAKVSNYLNHLRQSKAMIVYDTYIWEVILSDGHSMGVDWNKFNYAPPEKKFGLSLGGAGPAIPGALGVGVVYNTASFALDGLVKFLKTQGTVETISQPKLSMLSGGTASFSNGTIINYASQIGSSTTGQTTNLTLTSAQVQTGLSMTLSGDISDGTVFTSVRMTLNDLQKFDVVTAIGTQVKMPQVASREVITDVRTGSNDTIMLAGITSSRSRSDKEGLPTVGTALLATSSGASIERTEMVIVLRPRVIRFVNAAHDAQAKAASAEAAAKARPQRKEKGPRVDIITGMQNTDLKVTTP